MFHVFARREIGDFLNVFDEESAKVLIYRLKILVCFL